MSDDLPDDLEADILGGDEDLPSDVGTDVSSTDGGGDSGTLVKWVLGAGGAIVAAYLAFYILSFVLGVVGFLLKWGLIFLAAYAVYRGIVWALSDDSAESGLDQQQIPASTEQETDALLEEDQVAVEGGEEVMIDESEISVDDAEVSIDESELSSADLEDSDLEEEFAELERELQND